MAKREFVQLAHPYDTDKHFISGYFMSEKLDGIRVFWDGGISRGIHKSEVPWANNTNDERYAVPPIATGLWTRYGNVIHAPDWFLDALPPAPLDGEMYSDTLCRQEIKGVISKIKPNDLEWAKVYYAVFDIVPLETIFEDGIIDTPHFKKKMNCKKCMDFIRYHNSSFKSYDVGTPRWVVESILEGLDWKPGICIQLKQETLPYATQEAVERIATRLADVISQGGEGLIIRNPNVRYRCIRTHNMVKIKEREDAEGTVVGYTTGRIGKEGRLRGLMGNLIIRIKSGQILELSGFEMSERQLVMSDGSTASAPAWAYYHPDTKCPDSIHNSMFPRGSVVTFRYRGKTKDGIPNEATYWRQR